MKSPQKLVFKSNECGNADLRERRGAPLAELGYVKRLISSVDFMAIASGATGESHEWIECRQCPDQYVGSIADIGAKKEFPLRRPASERPPDQRCLIMVLESPHTNEFVDEPAPAKG